VKVTDCDPLVVPTACPAKLKLEGTAVTGTIPTPVRLIVGLTFALSVIVRVALRAPATDGVKKTETVQLALGSSLFGVSGQLLESVKSARFVAILLMVSFTLRLLVTVIVATALFTPSTWGPKERLEGVAVTAGVWPFLRMALAGELEVPNT
jgi:hypothetical protein